MLVPSLLPASCCTIAALYCSIITALCISLFVNPSKLSGSSDLLAGINNVRCFFSPPTLVGFSIADLGSVPASTQAGKESRL